MKLEQQVVSLELAQKLKELGVRQESLWNWLIASDGARLLKNPVLDTYRYFEQRAAFTVAELGEMLPEAVISMQPLQKNEWDYVGEGRWECFLPYTRMGRMESGGYLCMSDTFMDFEITHVESADTEADARAKMLIYLIENKLLDLSAKLKQ